MTTPTPGSTRCRAPHQPGAAYPDGPTPTHPHQQPPSTTATTTTRAPGGTTHTSAPARPHGADSTARSARRSTTPATSPHQHRTPAARRGKRHDNSSARRTAMTTQGG
ncbi:hypothetical protein ACH445_20825, partial [Micromonospora aurantiaca]